MEELIEKIKEYKIIVICVSLGLVLGGFFLLNPIAQTPAKESNLQTEVTTVLKDSTDEKEDGNQKEEVVEQDLITVDIKGAVKSPGIYDLPVGSRINDAVQKAVAEALRGKTPRLKDGSKELTKEDILKIKNRSERQKAMAEHPELFR